MSILEVTDTEKIRLINSFPSSLRKDVEEVFKILPFDEHTFLADRQIHRLESLMHPLEQTVSLDGEILKIPCRNYFNEPQADKENQLTVLQKKILNCIYLRHHDGFVRQRRLAKLTDNTEYFIVPYAFQLLGEYVIEILEDLDSHIDGVNIENYTKFINENKKYWTQTQSRMTSYWNEYYRRPKFPKLNDYIGKRIVDKIKANAGTLDKRDR